MNVGFPNMGLGHLSLLSRHGCWCTCRRKGKFQVFLFAKESNTKRTNEDFPFLRPVNPNVPRGWILRGSNSDQIWNRIFEKTRVGFRSPELSLRLSCTEFSALQSGHGPRGKGFHGGSPGADFCILWGVNIWGGSKNMKMQNEIGQISISGALDKCKLIS